MGVVVGGNMNFDEGGCSMYELMGGSVLKYIG